MKFSSSVLGKCGVFFLLASGIAFAGLSVPTVVKAESVPLFDPALFMSGVITAPAAAAAYTNIETIPIAWNQLPGTTVSIVYLTSPEPLNSLAPAELATRLAGLSRHSVPGAESLANVYSITLPYGRIPPGEDYYLVIMDDQGNWGISPGPFRITEELSEPACEAVTEIPALEATMEITGGYWGNPDATWIDHTGRNRSQPDATDTVLVSGDILVTPLTADLAGLLVAQTERLTLNGANLLVHGSIVNYGTISNGSNNGMTRTYSGGLYNLGTWNNFFLGISGGADAAHRQRIEIMSAQPFGNATVAMNGYLELAGCATLPGVGGLGENTVINEPSGITITHPGGASTVSGSGFLKVAAGQSNSGDFAISADATNGPLKRLIFESAAVQPLRIGGSGLTAEEIHFKGGEKRVELNGTVNGNVTVWPGAALRSPAANRILTIDGDVENRGYVLADNSFVLKVTGDIINHAGWNPSRTDLLGSAPRTIGGSVPLGGTVTIADSFLLRDSTVFNGTVIFGSGSLPAILDFPAELPEPTLEFRAGAFGAGGASRAAPSFSTAPRISAPTSPPTASFSGTASRPSSVSLSTATS